MINPVKILCLLIFSFSLLACSESEDNTQPKSSEKTPSSFTLNGVQGSVSEADKTIKLSLPAGTDLSSFTPVISLPANARISPASGVAQDFSKPVAYTITAEDGTAITYTVIVTVQSTALQEKPIVVASSPSICQSSSIILTVSNPVAGATYSWYSATGGLIAGAISTSYTATQAGSYWAVANTNGGSSPASDPVVITINAATSSKPIIVSTTGSICQGGSAVLTVSNAIVGATYSWYSASGGLIVGTASSSYAVTQAGSYWVVANVGGCSSAASEAVVITVNAGVNSKPIVIAPTGSICQGSSVSLTVTNPVAGATYSWYSASGGLIANTSTPSYMVTQAGSYWVAANVGDCSSPVSAQVVITANSKPVIVTTTQCISQSGNIVLTVSNPVAGATYSWYGANGGLIVGATSSNYTVTQAGSYWVIANVGGCASLPSSPAVITSCP